MVVATTLMGPHERVSRTHVPAGTYERCTVRCGGISLPARCQMSDVARDSGERGGAIDRPRPTSVI